MDVRKPVKHLLRMCGHAIVITVHERLDNVDRQLDHILDQNVHLAQNQTALLQSGVHLVQSLPQIQSEVQQVEMRLASLVRDHCAAKPDLEAVTGQLERIRRELNHTFTNFADTNAQVLAGHLDGFGHRLDDAMSSSQGLREEIDSARQGLENAVNNVDRQLAHILDQNIHLAQNQTALLQSGVHLVQSLPQIKSEFQQVEVRLASLVRDHCAAKPDLEAAIGQMERIRRESNYAFAKIAATNAQELAEHLDGFGHRLDNAVSSSQVLGEVIESMRQRLVDAVNNLATANAEVASANSQALAGHLEGFGHRLDNAVSRSQGLGEVIESMRQRLVDAVNNLATGNAEVASANSQTLAGHLEGFGHRLDNAVSSSQGLGEVIESMRQRLVDAVNKLATANAEVSSANSQALAGYLEGFGHRLDGAVSSSQGLGEVIESMRQRLVDVVNNLATANAEAQEVGLTILRPTLASVLNLEREYSATRNSIALLEPVARETRSFLANEAVRQVVVETSEYAPVNPELGLMCFLYSHLPGRKAMDIGAHIGEVSSCLLKTGYEVYAFEPYPPNYTRLRKRMKGQRAFHAFNMALGAVDGELPLHLVTDSTKDHTFDDPTVFHSLAPHGMPDGLSFDGATTVPVKRVADLHRSGVVPADISLVKIDTEGYDLEVIRGMEGHRYPVVCAEFWDTQIPFASNGLLYTFESIVREMGQRSYFWYIVLYRVWGLNQTAFFCNHNQSVPGSWGNLFFFRDHATFQQAQQWCAAVLPRTYFKSVPASQATTK